MKLPKTLSKQDNKHCFCAWTQYGFFHFAYVDFLIKL